MGTLESISLKISNYKCFGEEGCGYQRILPVNLIIGRNNAGKSTLLDLIEYACRPRDLSSLSHRGKPPLVTMETTLKIEDLGKVFQHNTSGGELGGNHLNYARQFEGKRLLSIIGETQIGFGAVVDHPNLRGRQYWEQLANSVVGNPFSQLSFKRLLADRDLVPESNLGAPDIRNNGSGATNAIQSFINLASLPREIVEKEMLNDLNTIFQPDGKFSDITTRLHADGRWEVFLEEAEKGLVPLTHSGSGVKTVLLVLAFLHLIPFHEHKSLDKYIFGFEELENNLHPALQRRLLLYLRNKAEAKGCHIFLTTHSNICIDLFAHDALAQILHVTHDSLSATAKSVVTYIDNKGILDDLDLRASDLLQANGLVWLEGPSDRLYFNRWIELWTDGSLHEGAHYQCVFYGGRLLAHLSAGDPSVSADDVVQLLKVNRNAILLIDSDRRAEDDYINATKTRIFREVDSFGGMSWVTAGKEIENYLPLEAMQAAYPTAVLKPLFKHQLFPAYLERIKKDEGKKFLRKKVLFAEKVLPYITKHSLAATLDLSSRLDKAVQTIRSWNRIGSVMST